MNANANIWMALNAALSLETRKERIQGLDRVAEQFRGIKLAKSHPAWTKLHDAMDAERAF